MESVHASDATKTPIPSFVESCDTANLVSVEGELFAKIDSDSDGELTRHELQAWRWSLIEVHHTKSDCEAREFAFLDAE